MHFDEKILLHTLQFKANKTVNGRLLEAVIEADNGHAVPTRQMCAKVSVTLYDQMEELCNILGMTKRDFIESAVADGLRRAQDVIEQSGILEDL